MHTNKRLKLIGLDFGSTTSSIMLLEVSVERHSLTGRLSYGDAKILLKPEPVFTPFKDGVLDTEVLLAQLDSWLALVAWQAHSETLFSGSALVTGNAAQSSNVALIKKLVAERIGPSLIANADDPKLESWMAFMGSAATLSRMHPERWILNLDIGGGTTNPALGIDGEVQECRCFFIGARHLNFAMNSSAESSYVLLGCSLTGKRLLKYLKIDAGIGDLISHEDIQRCITFFVQCLEAIVDNNREYFSKNTFLSGLVQAPERSEWPPAIPDTPIVTFSGGVGELIYQFLETGVWPSFMAYGDLGVGLAQAIVASPSLSTGLNFRPENMGRATVIGLTLHSSDISGSSVFISHPECLPLSDLPILARLTAKDDVHSWQRCFNLAKNTQNGACFVIQNEVSIDYKNIRLLADTISNALVLSEYPCDQALVLLIDANIGKTLGHYLSDWGKRPRTLFVIDELPLRDARFIQLGTYQNGFVPVSFFSMH